MTYDLSLDAMNDLVNTSPLIRVLGLPSNDAEALQNVDDVIDPSSFNIELLGALIQQEEVLVLLAVDHQEPSA